MIKPPEVFSLLRELKLEEEFHITFTSPGPQYLLLLESIVLLMGALERVKNKDR
jgi:hypothetical protein